MSSTRAGTGAESSNDAQSDTDATSAAEAQVSQSSDVAPSADVGMPSDVQVRIAEIRAAAARYIAWVDKLPWVITAVAATACVYFLAGQRTIVDFRLVASASLAVAAPAALAKILWDRRQKRRLRGEKTELEDDNRGLRDEVRRLRSQVQRLEGALEEARRSH